MPYRFVVLYEEVHGRAARPVGIAIERDDSVRVEVRDDLCMPKHYSEPFLVAGPDMTTIRYTPDDKRYFDQVLIDLSRTFAIANEGVLMDSSEATFRKLLLEKVLRPLRLAEAHQYRSIQLYHKELGYVHEKPVPAAPTKQSAPREKVSAREPVLVA